MKLVTLTVFGAGYVLGSRAGRERYEQLLSLARNAYDGFEGIRAQDRLESYAGRLEAFASRNGRSSLPGEPRPRAET